MHDWLHRAYQFYNGECEIVGSPVTRLDWKKGGVTIVGHMKDKNAFEAYQGHEYQKGLFEELTQIPDEESYLKVLGSIRSIKHPELRPQVFNTANPGGRGHNWVKKRFVDVAKNKVYIDPKTGRSRLFIPATVEDNPALVINDPDYIKFLEGLPEPLRSAWRFGNWEIFVGQYFMNFGSHLEEYPFKIPPHESQGRLYGSLDYGYGLHGTSSFGLWWLDFNYMPHRLFTWYRTGLTASEQADDLYDMVESFPYTEAVFPQMIACDGQMFVNNNEDTNSKAPIDYFKERFKKVIKPDNWVRANKSRVNGWQLVLDYFQPDVLTKKAKMKYWPDYNSTFEENFPLMVRDENNVDDVLKCPLDHVCDEARYGLVMLKSIVVPVKNPETKRKSRLELQEFNEKFANSLAGVY
jgi:hypothetical protein